MKTLYVVAAIIKNKDKILIVKRGYGQFKGLYEFPGGKVEPGETPHNALKREIKEELNAQIEIDCFYYQVNYTYPDFILKMDCYLCHLVDSHIELREHLDKIWINPREENPNIQWVPADIEIIQEIQQKGFSRIARK